MKRKALSILAGLALLVGGGAAQAQAPSNTIKVALCYDLSKAYTFATPQLVQATKDYATLLNSKGGIEGRPIEIVVQDTGNEPQRGIECYEKLKREGVMMFHYMSTPVGNAVLPRHMQDGNIMLSPFYGRSDAVDGDVFKWIFPIGPTYWGQMANNVAWIKAQHKGNLKGVKIAYIYPDYALGHEPLPVIKTLAQREGFELGLFPNPMPGRDQAAVWTQIRRFDPAHVISWNLEAMHVVAAKEMKRNGIPMDKLITVNWLNEVDLNNIGLQEAKGLKRGTNVVGGKDHPLMQRIIKEVYGANKGAGDIKNMDDMYYNTALAIFSPLFEGVRLALKKDPKGPLTPAKIKEGLESLRNFDANGFIAPVTVTAKDHGGGGKTRVDMWDGTKWVPQSDWMSAYADVVDQIVKEQSAKWGK